jgi:hypothetical protein
LCRRRFDEADRRFERAMKTLAEIKKLLPRTLIQVGMLHSPRGESSGAPILPNAYGEQPQTGDGHKNGSKNRLSGETAESVTGSSRIEGRSRACKLLVPAGDGAGP